MNLKVGLNWWRPYGGSAEVIVIRKREELLEARRATSFVNSWTPTHELERDGEFLGEAVPPEARSAEPLPSLQEEEGRRRGRPKIHPPEEAIALLGKKKDSMIAQMFGVSPALVARWRGERGIGSTRKKPAQSPVPPPPPE
jgi:hypothetical protein